MPIKSNIEANTYLASENIMIGVSKCSSGNFLMLWSVLTKWISISREWAVTGSKILASPVTVVNPFPSFHRKSNNTSIMIKLRSVLIEDETHIRTQNIAENMIQWATLPCGIISFCLLYFFRWSQTTRDVSGQSGWWHALFFFHLEVWSEWNLWYFHICILVKMH